MLVYAGIDEAGYGPLLGPLCVAASVFVIERSDASRGAPDLWTALDGAVCRAGNDRRGRVAVDDSKRLKGANDAKGHPLRHLERGVLAFLAAGGEVLPADDGALVHQLGASPPCRDEAPWYDGVNQLPMSLEAGQIEIAAATLRRAFERAGVRCTGLLCEIVDAGEFNRRFGLSRNKATVSFDSVVQLVESIWRRWPEEHPRVVIDRQGGRSRYREALSLCFPEAEITVLGETERVSRYRLDRRGSRLTVSFEAESESAHLPTALASMTAKLVRELLMARFNRWFAAQCPGVRRTAGYVQDGRRWLAEVAPALDALRIDREHLVRRA